MGLDLVKFKFGKEHGSRKKGEVVSTPRSTAEALVHHKLGTFSEMDHEEKKRVIEPVVKVKNEKKINVTKR